MTISSGFGDVAVTLDGSLTASASNGLVSGINGITAASGSFDLVAGGAVDIDADIVRLESGGGLSVTSTQHNVHFHAGDRFQVCRGGDGRGW